MLESVGHAVSRLIRIRYGAMLLPKGLKRGAWMELEESDISSLVRAADGPEVRAPREKREPRLSSDGLTPAQRPPRRGDNIRKPRVDGINRQAQGKSAQPDPMKTSLGYIGADSFTRQRDTRGNGRGGGRGPSQGGSDGAFGAPSRGNGPNNGPRRGGRSR